MREIDRQLFKAIDEGVADKIKTLLDDGANLQSRYDGKGSESQLTPLQYAIDNCSLIAVNTIIAHQNFQTDKDTHLNALTPISTIPGSSDTFQGNALLLAYMSWKRYHPINLSLEPDFRAIIGALESASGKHLTHQEKLYCQRFGEAIGQQEREISKQICDPIVYSHDWRVAVERAFVERDGKTFSPAYVQFFLDRPQDMSLWDQYLQQSPHAIGLNVKGLPSPITTRPTTTIAR